MILLDLLIRGKGVPRLTLDPLVGWSWWLDHGRIGSLAHIVLQILVDYMIRSILASLWPGCMVGPISQLGGKPVFCRTLLLLFLVLHLRRALRGWKTRVPPPWLVAHRPFSSLVRVFLKHCSRLVLLFDGAWGLNTLTSMKVRSSLPPQKPFAATSSLALSVVFVTLVSYNRLYSSWH